MTDELKPCPFCKSVNLKTGCRDKHVGVCCQNCGAMGPNHYDSRYDWNTRPDTYTLDEIKKVLEAAASLVNRGGLRTRSDAASELLLEIAEAIRAIDIDTAAGRQSLAHDGGKKARTALAALKGTEE